MAIFDLYTVTNKYSGFEFKDFDTVILIDIYRATSTIVTAFANGAIEIVPCVEIEQVLNLKSKDNKILTAGERNGKKIIDFDFDNSPISFDKKSVQDQRIALTTTNCTKAIDIAKKSNQILFSCFLNLSSTIEYIINHSKQIERLIILCAGQNEFESEEDNLFAIELLFRLNSLIGLNLCERSQYLLNSRLSLDESMYKLRNSLHAKRLISIGKRKDIDFSLFFDKFDCVPIYVNDSIKLK